jgi:alcohol dehydrogenase (cytochrome c)
MVALTQGVDPDSFALKPVTDWPTYHGDYSGQRYSPLTEIDRSNVGSLTEVWRFDTGIRGTMKATPILVGDIMYVTMPDNIWAFDARTAEVLWHYEYPMNDAFHIGQRGASVHGDTVYMTTPDAHLLAFDRMDGTLKWNVEIADWRRGYWSTNAPLVIRNHVIVGVSGDFDNVPGMLKSVDAETGETQWIFYSTPPAGTGDGSSGGASGGQMWMSGTYDPELNLMYVGTGNPTPVLNGEARPGDNPWTCAIVALNPDTGELVWGFQTSPHDTHDWDAAEVPVLVDAEFEGEERKLLLQASRNGYFFVLDRETGENLVTTPFTIVNWAMGIDELGRPIPDSAKEPSRDGVLVAPNEAGGTNYRSPGFDPENGRLLVNAQDGYGIYFFKPEHGDYGWAGADYNLSGKSYIRAIDFRTGEIAWSHPIGNGAGAAGVLTTASGLAFTGDNSGNLLVLDTATGETLWHRPNTRVGNGPITYEMDGRQVVVVGAGGALVALALSR